MKFPQQYSVLKLSTVVVLCMLMTACARSGGGLGLRVDSVDDTVAYRASKTIKALAIPPGLSAPDFDPTFATNSQEDNVGKKVTIVKLSQGGAAIATNESAASVWKRLGDLLAGVNLRVKSKDPVTATYTVLYNGGDKSPIPRKGWLNRALGLEKENTVQEGDEAYTVKVARQGDVTLVGITPAKDGSAATAQKLLNQLKLELEI